MRTFVDQVYVPDTLAIAGFYKDWFHRGEGLGNFMTYGDFPPTANRDVEAVIPAGVILNRDLSHIEPVDLNDPAQMQEFVPHSWYDYSTGKDAGLHPYDGETTLDYDGPKPPYDQLDVDKGYSWIKRRAGAGNAIEVGPLARVLMLYAKGHEPTKALAGYALGKLGVPLEAMYSTLGRTAARTLETKIIADQMDGWLDALIANIKAGDVAVQNRTKWEPSTWPSEARGVGFMEAPRGGARPLDRDRGRQDRQLPGGGAHRPGTPARATRRGSRAPTRRRLPTATGSPIPKQPLEIQRTIHSFDPCIACAVHVADPEGKPLVEIEVS